MRWFISMLFISFPAFAQDAGVAPVPAVSDVAVASGSATDWKGMLLGIFWKFVFPLFGSAILALIMLGLHKLNAWLAAQAQTNKVASIGLQLETVVEHFVADAEVSLKPQFDKSMDDGKLTAAEGAALKAEVIKQLKEKTAPEVMDAIKAQFGAGAIDNVLGGAVEKAVAKLG